MMSKDLREVEKAIDRLAENHTRIWARQWAEVQMKMIEAKRKGKK